MNVTVSQAELKVSDPVAQSLCEVNREEMNPRHRIAVLGQHFLSCRER